MSLSAGVIWSQKLIWNTNFTIFFTDHTKSISGRYRGEKLIIYNLCHEILGLNLLARPHWERPTNCISEVWAYAMWT
jgi:hypothetical protein